MRACCHMLASRTGLRSSDDPLVGDGGCTEARNTEACECGRSRERSPESLCEVVRILRQTAASAVP